MKSSKPPTPSSSSLKQALLGLYGITGVVISTFGPFKIPFAESHAKEYWRHALAGIFLVVMFFVGIISLSFYLFDANYFKSQMVDYVKTHNQRDLTLEGDIKVTFFPQLGLDSGKMSLSQRNSSKGFASIENARFYIAWLPLIRKQLQIERVSLEGVHANIIRYKDGTSNFADLLVADNSLNEVKFEIDSLKIKNSSANFQDESSGTLFALHDLNIETGKLSDATPGKVSATFRLESNKPHIDTKVKLSSHILFELKANHYEFDNVEGELDGEIAGLTNLLLNFQGSINSYQAAGRFVVEKFVANAKGKLENRKLDAKLELPKLEIIKNKLNGNSLNFKANLLQEDENLNASFEIPTFELNYKKLTADTVTSNFDLFKTGRTLQGKFTSPLDIDFETMLIKLPNMVSSLTGSHPIFANKLTASLSGNLLLNANEQQLKLDFKSKIDESNFQGSFSVQDFARPTYTVNVGVDTLDLDRYLATDYSKRWQDNALPFDFNGIKDLNLRCKLRGGEFTFAKLKASNLVADIKIDPSNLLIEPLNARLYKGSAAGSLSISTSDTPRVALKQKLIGIQFNRLFTDFSPGEAKLIGKGDLILDLIANGSNIADLRKSMTGRIAWAVGRGSLAGINLAKTLLANKLQLGEAEAVKTEAAKFTETLDFTELKSTFDINEGNIHSRDFLLKSPLFSSAGEGDILLDSGQISYRLNTTLANNLKRSVDGELAELKGITIPMRVTGPYLTPLIIMELGNASGGNLAKLIQAKNPPPPTPSVKIKTGKKKTK